MTTGADERRGKTRRRVLRGGKIFFHQLGTSADCRVRSVSEAGACLIITSPVGIPNEFQLVLDRDKTPRGCRVEWRSANQIGVSFL